MRPSAAGTPTAPATPQEMREVTGVGPSAEAATRVRLQLPAKSTVSAAYQAKDGYLVVNTAPDGDKQLVLQDDSDKQQVLVDDASNITLAKDGSTVAWASQGPAPTQSPTQGPSASPAPSQSPSPAPSLMNVGVRSDQNHQKIIKGNSVAVPPGTQPVTFVGTNLVLSNDDKGFDVWHTERGYSPTWDKTVARVFGGTPDNSGVYAEVNPGPQDAAMCLALLLFDQPFKVRSKVCGLPVAAQAGARISPDGHWLAYPVAGAKQVAILDLTAVFTGAKAKVWSLAVGSKTVWLNPTTFVVDNGTKFCVLDPTGKTDVVAPLDQDSDGVVLIEPLANQ